MNRQIEFIGNIREDIKLEQEAQLVIFGCGKTGKEVFEVLRERGLSSKVAAFCDSNPALCGKQLDGVKIISVEEAAVHYKDAAYLAAGCCVRAMVEALQSCGVKKIHITRGGSSD